MGRKRSPEHDWICRRCGCPCEADGSKHVGGGQGMRACKMKPDPILRADHEREVAETMSYLLSRRAGP